MQSVTLLLSSAGRRPYLVDWFKDGLRETGVSGRVVVVDADKHATSRDAADAFIVAPLVTDAEYDDWLAATLTDEGVDLAVSVNDFELSHWSKLHDNFPLVDRLLRLDSETQKIIEDKILMARALMDHGVRVPRTLTATVALADLDSAVDSGFVTKGRFGSASRGLRMATVGTLRDMAHEAVREVTDARGRAVSAADPHKLDLLVVQQRVHGEEYGLDIVSDLDGRYSSTLARRKIAMRGGETDRAVSVDAKPFDLLGRQISAVIPHRGSIDVDVIVDADGIAWVIDINPRFGGGYPFSHLAGAHTPAAYVAWLTGAAVDPAWLASEPGVLSGKFVGISRSQ